MKIQQKRMFLHVLTALLAVFLWQGEITAAGFQMIPTTTTQEYNDEQWMLERLERCPEADLLQAWLEDKRLVIACADEEPSDFCGACLSATG